MYTASIYSASQSYGAISVTLSKRLSAQPQVPALNETNETVPQLDRKANCIRLFNLALMGVVIMGFGMCVSLFAPFFPTEAARRGVSATTVGLVFSCFTLVMFIGSITSGLLIRTLGLHFMIWSGTLLAGGSTVLFGLLDQAPPGDSYVALCFIVRLIEGAGASLYNTAAFSIVGELYPQHIAQNYAILEASSGVGRMIGPSLGGVLFSAGGFSLPFYVVGSMLLVMGFLSQAALRLSMPREASQNNDTETSGTSENKPPKSLPWSHFYRVSLDIWIITITLALGSILVGFPQPTIALYFEQLGLTDAVTIGGIFLSVSLVYIISAMIVGKLADKYPAYVFKMLIFGSLLNAITYALSGPAPMLMPLLTPSVGLTVGSYLFAAIAMAIVINPAPQAIIDAAHAAGYKDGLDTSAMVASLYNGMWFFGSFVSAPLAGLLMDLVGFQWGAFIMAVIAIFMALLSIGRELLHKFDMLRVIQLYNYQLFYDESVV